MRERITDSLEVVALLMIAAGTTGGLWQIMSWFALIVGAAVLILGSWVATREPSTARHTSTVTVAASPRSDPGPHGSFLLGAPTNTAGSDDTVILDRDNW